MEQQLLQMTIQVLIIIFYIAKQLKAGYVYELIISTYSYGEQTFDLVTKMSCLHKYLESIEKASCKREGKIIYTCKYCLDNYEIEIPKTDHEYEYKTIAPTCTEKGYTHVGCKNCDYSKDENYVDALGHDYDIVTVYPKEGKDGYVAHICRTCNDIFKTEYVEESKVEEITTTNTRIDTTTATTKSIETKVSKTKIRKLTAGKKKVKISWKKIKGVKGYQVKISKQKNFKKSITKNVKVTKITIKKLKSKQKYYVKVRSYKIISGAKKYSDWSKIGRLGQNSVIGDSYEKRIKKIMGDNYITSVIIDHNRTNGNKGDRNMGKRNLWRQYYVDNR